jgi:hypothetical protein
VPVRGTFWGLPPPLSLTEMDALRFALAEGVKVTVIKQLAPAATLVPQVLVWAKSPALVPVTETPVMLTETLAGDFEHQDTSEKSASNGPQKIILKKLDEIVKALGPRVSTQAQSRTARAKPSFPTKRDTILFAAIVRDLQGVRYCTFLDKHRVKPKWIEDGPKSYQESS